MKTKVLIFSFWLFGLLFAYGANDETEIILQGDWLTGVERSYAPNIPISGKVSNGLLILTNERPNKDITVTLTDSQGIIIIKKEFPKESSSYMVISLDGLQESETYTVTLTSTIPSDYLYATINF